MRIINSISFQRYCNGFENKYDKKAAEGREWLLAEEEKSHLIYFLIKTRIVTLFSTCKLMLMSCFAGGLHGKKEKFILI